MKTPLIKKDLLKGSIKSSGKHVQGGTVKSTGKGSDKLGAVRTKKRADICLSLCCGNLQEIREDLYLYQKYAQYVEWCVHETSGVDSWSEEEYVSNLTEVRRWTRGKKLIVVYRGDDNTAARITRWSFGIADYVDVSFGSEESTRLIREAKRGKTKVILSFHDNDGMLRKDEIGELYLKMEKEGGDILKIACMANEEMDTYEILEGAAMYTSLKHHKPIIAVAMGEEGQVSRICAGDFGSVLSYGCGSKQTAAGQFNVEQLDKYMTKYYGTKEI